MSVEQWRRTHQINVEGTFLTARTWLRQIRDCGSEAETKLHNVSLIIVGSESGHFGERGNADYAAGKSAVQGGLLRSLVGDVARIWPGAR
jgi:NAD(P)-dependent dehydrogenase (short-subunit alcohol dehydrogenase family)